MVLIIMFPTRKVNGLLFPREHLLDTTGRTKSIAGPIRHIWGYLRIPKGAKILASQENSNSSNSFFCWIHIGDSHHLVENHFLFIAFTVTYSFTPSLGSENIRKHRILLRLPADAEPAAHHEESLVWRELHPLINSGEFTGCLPHIFYEFSTNISRKWKVNLHEFTAV